MLNALFETCVAYSAIPITIQFMNWILLTYSLPSHSSTPRVTFWRRLRRLGAISPTGSVYILPANDECVEAFQWLAQEIRQTEGEALVMHAQHVSDLDDAQLTTLFNQARHEEYQEIAAQLDELERQFIADETITTQADLQTTVNKLQKQHTEIERIDYFHCSQGPVVAAQLNRVRDRLASDGPLAPQVAPAALLQYRHRRWVTRPRPHVDRLACAWLIRRYVDAEAVIRYSTEPERDEVAFDMSEAEFGHQGNLCTFEVMLRAFDLKEPALPLLAEIVHDIDLRDGRYQRPETAGIDAILKGWLLAGLTDADLERQGIALFDALFAALSHPPGTLTD